MEKKHKRTYQDSTVVLGEEGNVDANDRGRKKKSKTEGLVDDMTCGNALAVVSNVAGDDKSKKKKKKKAKSEVGGEDGKIEKWKRKKRELEDGGEGGVSCELMSGAEEHVREDGKVKEVKKKKKKKKNKAGLKTNEEDFNGVDGMVELDGCVGNSTMRNVIERAEAVENKKKRKKEKKNHGVTEEVEPTKDKKHKKGKDIDEVTERIEPVKDTKQKKKKTEKEQHTAACIRDEEGHKDDSKVHSRVKDKEKKKKGGKHSAASRSDEVEHDKGSKIQKTVASKSRKDANEKNDSADPIEKSNRRKESRRVKFADRVEIFPLSNNTDEAGNENLVDGSNSREGKDGSNSREGEEGLAYGGYSSEEEESLLYGNSGKGKKLKPGSDSKSSDGLVQGKRFSKDEDEMLKLAVQKYVDDHRLGEEGVEMVMKCRQHRKKVKGCWKEIAQALPWRTKEAVYCRAHILFERGESRKWSKEELEMIREFYQKHGPKWRELADEMGRHRVHVKDAFRQVKLANKKVGQWSQEEYQSLFDLVNEDLRMKIFMDRKSQHGMLRDNIGWESISRSLSTRTDPICCQKWYNQLTSPLVARGEWSDADDYRLLIALVDLDATCEEGVDWDNLVEHRSGDVCRKRWYEMVRHIGKHGTMSFSDQVDILSQRYCQDVLEAREIYDSKPVVD